MKSVVIGILVTGFLLFIIGSLWTTLFSSASWTEEKHKRSTEIKHRLNNLGPLVNGPVRNMHSGPDRGTLQAEFDALLKEEEQLDADFETAAYRPQTISTILKWTGISLAAVGLIGWYAVREA